MTIFKVGDRVLYKTNGNYLQSGDLGTVCHIDGYSIGVNWDKVNPYFHDCDGRCPDCHGWYVNREGITLVTVPYNPDQEPEDDCL